MISFQNIVPQTCNVLIYYHNPEFTGDYTGIDIVINDDLITSYGDYYHDKGLDKANGFIDAVKILFPDCIISKFKNYRQ